MMTIRKSSRARLLFPAAMLFSCPLLCVPSPSVAQSGTDYVSLTDSAQIPADDNLVLQRQYLRAIGESSRLYTGIQYIRNGEKTEGFPFFGAGEPLTGSVSINNVAYPDLSLQLDLVGGQLITRNLAGTSLFVIEPGIVDSFVLDNHRFVSVKGSNLLNLRPGYYERLLSGSQALYIRWEKKLQTRPDYALSIYRSYDQVFLMQDGIIHNITGRKELMQLLPDSNGDLKKFIRSENLNFKKDLAGASAATFRHYQNLKR